jgi:hypothetical protein
MNCEKGFYTTVLFIGGRRVLGGNNEGQVLRKSGKTDGEH